MEKVVLEPDPVDAAQATGERAVAGDDPESCDRGPDEAGDARRHTPGLSIDAVVSKTLQECQNGLLARCYVLGREELAASSLEQVVLLGQRLGARVWRRPDGVDVQVPRACVSVQQTPGVVVVAGHRLDQPAPDPLPPPHGAREIPVAGEGRPEELSEPTLEPYQRAQLVAAVGLRAGRPLDVDTLRGLLRDESLVVQVLASECLNQQGEPAIPELVWEGRAEATGPAPTRERFTEAFEARITVDEYAFHEAVHPAYARQVLELARMARTLTSPPERILDVGSGPGLPTIMLTELFPSAHIDAVEPSPCAAEHLRANAAGLPITPMQTAVQDLPRAGRYDLVTCVGTSHHLDTREFLRSCHQLMKPQGLALVADEMIEPFDTEQERTAALIRHHWAYIREVLANVDEGELPPPERERLRAFRETREPTPDALASLLERAGRDRVPPGGRSPWPRVRLAVLELEALVAGIAYDVERKTYPRNFIALAADAALELLDHTRVHATSGDHPFAAGTHAFCFRRVRETG